MDDFFPFKISQQTKSFLKVALKEDIGQGDKTTELLIPRNARGKAVIIARESGVFCGLPVVYELFRILDPSLKIQFFVSEGERFSKNKIVIRVQGDISSILKVERTVLNFLSRLSAIATKTRQFVDRVKGFPVFILDTRKTTPLWREIEKYAVRVGGGRNHRMGLYDAIFVKENHRPYGNLQRLRPFRGQFEIEVRNLKELKEALKLVPRIILLDNFSPAGLRRAVQWARDSHPEVILEASGGITLENVAHYAAMGVDWISVGALTHSVKSIDFSLLVS
jgi:nicotinate-nucleotide pyrophosphorylase (carboxylating)